MFNRIEFLWFKLLSTFWFRPGILALSAVPLAVLTLALDETTVAPWLTESDFLFRSGVEGARQILTAVIGSLITVTSLVFSITIVALSITASQLGPRLIQLFTKGTATQFVLGSLIANLVFAFIVLRSISGPVNDTAFAPPVSLSLAIVGTLFNLGLLIYFLHNTAQKIDADAVIGAISDELSETIETSKPTGVTLTPRQDCQSAEQELEKANLSHEARLCAKKTGYIQIIETNDLRDIASTENLVIRLAEKPSRFVIKGVPIARIFANEPIADDLIDKINNKIVVGRQRTPAQDVEFSVAALVEVALRALSPGLNDPYTAITCIDRLSAGLAAALDTGLPQSVFHDENKALRVLIAPTTYQGVFDTAFNGIRQDCRGKVAVIIRLLESLETLAYLTDSDEQRDAVKTHVDRVITDSEKMDFSSDDREDFSRRVQSVKDSLGEKSRS